MFPVVECTINSLSLSLKHFVWLNMCTLLPNPGRENKWGHLDHDSTLNKKGGWCWAPVGPGSPPLDIIKDLNGSQLRLCVTLGHCLFPTSFVKPLATWLQRCLVVRVPVTQVAPHSRHRRTWTYNQSRCVACYWATLHVCVCVASVSWDNSQPRAAPQLIRFCHESHQGCFWFLTWLLSVFHPGDLNYLDWPSAFGPMNIFLRIGK